MEWSILSHNLLLRLTPLLITFSTETPFPLLGFEAIYSTVIQLTPEKIIAILPTKISNFFQVNHCYAEYIVCYLKLTKIVYV